MIIIESQVHGYKQGHQLLASSTTLSKIDQSTIDRLSDVAGPLRPGEKFAPYISAYPLPSGKWFVLAKTWQDLNVARAGCVRTLSLLIQTSDWLEECDLSKFFDELAGPSIPEITDAVSRTILEGKHSLQPVDDAPAELIEALFLEEPQPVAVFDALQPELISIRLLTSLWPALRVKYTLSTFALSPRKVDGRDFDLVFSPKDARSRFSDWGGRRVDGRSSKEARHRWTNEIANRIYCQDRPHLLLENEINIFGKNNTGDTDSTKLRLALLWRELLMKISSTPVAALGLLDIANSGKISNIDAISMLEPHLHNAISSVLKNLPASEAWAFLTAILRKTDKYSLRDVTSAIANTAEKLTMVSPEGSISFLSSVNDETTLSAISLNIAHGLGSNFSERSESTLADAPTNILTDLLCLEEKLARHATSSPKLINRIATLATTLDKPQLKKVSTSLLPLLTQDFQAPAAAPLIYELDNESIIDELLHLGTDNDFLSPKLASLVMARIAELDATAAARDSLLSLPASYRRDHLVTQVISFNADDISWLLEKAKVSDKVKNKTFNLLAKSSTPYQLLEVITSEQIGSKALTALAIDSHQKIEEIIFHAKLSNDILGSLVSCLLSTNKKEISYKVIELTIQQFFQSTLEEHEQSLLSKLLSLSDERLDISWLSRIALGKRIPSTLINRNMSLICSAPQPVRTRIIKNVAEIALCFYERSHIGLSPNIAKEFSNLLIDSESKAPDSALKAAAYLLPIALEERYKGDASIVIATFPLIYRNLAKSVDIPILHQLISFFDWDRCKTMREQLTSAFISSSWRPVDLAYTAWRAGDTEKILRRVYKRPQGSTYLSEILNDLESLPQECRWNIEKTVTGIIGKND